MSAAFVAFVIALGAGGWSYFKLLGHTGYGNNRSPLIGAVVIFVLAFVVVFTVGRMILK